ncbi:MAG TPA: hypothetical protein VFL85_04900, partial [Candidatus Saccharimonadales bacterium]|nr:hypothetical protein [Candidatus Saccharimonadales bacterium]
HEQDNPTLIEADSGCDRSDLRRAHDAATLMQLLKPVVAHVVHNHGGVAGSIVTSNSGQATIFTARNSEPDVKLVIGEPISHETGPDTMDVALTHAKGGYRQEKSYRLSADGESALVSAVGGKKLDQPISEQDLCELMAAYDSIHPRLTDRPEALPGLDYKPAQWEAGHMVTRIARRLVGS